MRYVFILLALFGIVVSSLALREHYREGLSPCSINDKWDCGIVNKSPYAMIGPIPVAAIGIAGYLLLGVLGAMRRYSWLLLASLVGLGFSLYLTHIEARILGVWCIYCVMSFATICLMTLLAIAAAILSNFRQTKSTPV